MANQMLTPAAWSYWVGITRESRPDTRFLTNTLLGGINLGNSKVKTSPIEDIKYDFYRKPQALAPMRGFHDEAVKLNQEDSREQRTIAIPSIPMEEDAGIRQAYDAVPAPMEDIRASAKRLNSVVKGQIADKLTGMKGLVARRIEYLLADIVEDGKISYDDGVYSYSHDFELEASFFFNAAKKWDVADADIIKDLRLWRKKYAKHTGMLPTMLICGENVADFLVYSDALKQRLDNYKVANWGNLDPSFKPSELGERILTLPGIGEMYSYYGQYDDATGTRKTYLDPDRVYMIAPQSFQLYYGSIYSTLFGNNPVKQTDVLTYVEEKQNHKGYKIYYETKPIPIVTNPYAVMSIKVL